MADLVMMKLFDIAIPEVQPQVQVGDVVHVMRETQSAGSCLPLREGSCLPLRVRADIAVKRAWKISEVVVDRNVVALDATWQTLDRRGALQPTICHIGSRVLIKAECVDAVPGTRLVCDIWGLWLNDLPEACWRHDASLSDDALRCHAGHVYIPSRPRFCPDCIEQIEGEKLPCRKDNGQRFCEYPAGHDGQHSYEAQP